MDSPVPFKAPIKFPRNASTFAGFLYSQRDLCGCSARFTDTERTRSASEVKSSLNRDALLTRRLWGRVMGPVKSLRERGHFGIDLVLRSPGRSKNGQFDAGCTASMIKSHICS